jgi:hypothetical protein
LPLKYLLVLVAAAPLQAQPGRPIVLKDAVAVRGLSGLPISPDGEHVDYTLAGVGGLLSLSAWLLGLRGEVHALEREG